MDRQLCAESGRLALRTFDPALVNERYLSWLHDERVTRFLLKPNRDTTLDDIRSYVRGLLESPDDTFLSITEKATGLHIGNVRLGPIDWRSSVCQYSMMIGDVTRHGQGLGSETVALALGLCFGELKMHKVFLDVVEENAAAIRIYEKNGFQTEGLLRAHKMLGGKLHDMRIMSCFRPEKG